jgi:hypothetical protein
VVDAWEEGYAAAAEAARWPWFWAQVAIAALLQREAHRKWAYGGIWDVGEGYI